MSARERKYALDTNIFIKAFRNRESEAELDRFHAAFAPFEYLSAIVAHELRARAQTRDSAVLLQRNIFAPFERRGRVVVPSYEAWKLAGEVLAKMSADKVTSLTTVSKSFLNDVLIAVSCRENGLVLVTENRKDFDRIRRFVAFSFVEPWPAPTR
jgi:predicted nucleic acid-binding protein